jgi:hypothetical protein
VVHARDRLLLLATQLSRLFLVNAIGGFHGGETKGRAGHMACVRGKIKTRTVLVEKPEGKGPFGRPRRG